MSKWVLFACPLAHSATNLIFLFSATLFVLTSLSPYLKKGDIVFFDEFAVPTHEFKAYTEFIQSYYLPLELIAAANNYYFAAFLVK